MAFGKAIERDNEAIFKKENAETIFNILIIFVKNSCPDLSQEDAEMFVMKNMMTLQKILIELSSNFGEGLNENQKKAIEELKAKQNG
jgi:hypothetical protein